MSFETLGDLNWLAVLVAAVAYFALGGVWYAERVFGGAYMRGIGFEAPPGWRPGPLLYVGPLAGAFVASVATALLARATGSDSLGEGLVLGVVVGVGYGLVLAGIVALNQQRPGSVFAVFGTYHLVGLVLVSVIVSTWS